jgi:mucin-19
VGVAHSITQALQARRIAAVRGGGGAHSDGAETTGGAGTSNEGFAGGDYTAGGGSGAGGGGAGAVGGTNIVSPATGGAGGAGITAFSVSVWRRRRWRHLRCRRQAVLVAVAQGQFKAVGSNAGTANTGGGGGGGRSTSGGAGGSGVVIIDAGQVATSTTGSPSLSGTIYTFTGSGSITF